MSQQLPTKEQILERMEAEGYALNAKANILSAMEEYAAVRAIPLVQYLEKLHTAIDGLFEVKNQKGSATEKKYAWNHLANVLWDSKKKLFPYTGEQREKSEFEKAIASAIEVDQTKDSTWTTVNTSTSHNMRQMEISKSKDFEHIITGEQPAQQPDEKYPGESDNDLKDLIIHGIEEGAEQWEKRAIAAEEKLKDWGNKILLMRDEMVKGDLQGAYHILYSIANPAIDSLKPWEEVESAQRPEPSKDDLVQWATHEGVEYKIKNRGIPGINDSSAFVYADGYVKGYETARARLAGEQPLKSEG